MLLAFIRENRAELIRRTREKVRGRPAPRATPEEIESGVPLFLTEFADLLEATREASRATYLSPIPSTSNADAPPDTALSSSATRRGNEMLWRGFTVAQVVHDYGDICQAVTELAGALSVQITNSEFHLLNLCLDNAIADAVTEFSRQRDLNIAGEEVERLGSLAHEARNLLSSATIAFSLVRGGTVAVGGRTSAVVERSLAGLRRLVDRSLAEVRLETGQVLRKRVLLAEFIEEIEAVAALDAKARGVNLTIEQVPDSVAIDVDGPLLASAVSNLLQNAYKFTRAPGHVSLRTRKKKDRVFIEVEDECGGLPAGKTEEFFRPFEKHGADRTGLGLGLTISRKSVIANGGEIRVENFPGKGCVFTIELPVAVQ